MKTWAFDTETHLIKPGCGAPRLVCFTIADQGARGTGSILNREDGMHWFKEKITDSGIRLVGHHTPYDLGIACAEDFECVQMVYDAIDDGRVTDTLLRQKIIDNAQGILKFEWDDELEEYKKQRYGLSYVAYRTLGRERDKSEDTWRMRYRELDGVPFEEWEDAALDYAIWDAEDTFGMYKHQYDLEPDIVGENWQMEAAWALHLAGVWGMRTDPERVEKIRAHFHDEWMKHLKIAQEWGFVRKDKKLSQDTKAVAAAIVEWHKLNDAGPALETPTGLVSRKREVLKATDHDGLQAVAEMGMWRKRLTTYVPILESGTTIPINPSYNAILETYRTSCARPNVQNFPQKGGMRECFVPREGWLYCFCDYGTLEMRTLAQVCLWLFGWSSMANALREGKDLHLDMAAEILGITYAEAEARFEDNEAEIIEYRKHSKPANFGFPGGMGAKKFIDYAAGYGITLTLEKAKALRATFNAKWPEMQLYFDHCAGLVGGDTAYVVEFLGSKMLRGDVMYTAVCNGFFQHLAAMGAKRAMYEVSKACYTDRNSPLWGCRPIAFIHDEIGLEFPPWVDAHAAAQEVSRIMIDTMKEWLPDLPVIAEAVLMRRWFKGAKPVFVEEGGEERLVPCKPEGRNWVADELN